MRVSAPTETTRVLLPCDESFRVLLVEPQSGGHRGQYVHHLAEQWPQLVPGARCIIAAPRSLIEGYGPLRRLLDSRSQEAKNWEWADLTEESVWSRGRSSVLSQAVARRGLLKLTNDLRPDACLFMHYDAFQLSLAALRCLPAHTMFHGIYFRPPVYLLDGSLRQRSLLWRLKRFGKLALLRAAARHTQLESLFVHDERLVASLTERVPGVRFVHLPDIGPSDSVGGSRDEARRRFGIEADERMFLVFGAISPRKGLEECLDAAAGLDTAKRRPVLLIAGRTDPSYRRDLRTRIDKTKRVSPLRVEWRDEFVDEALAQNLFAACDAVLLTYPNHEGSSGVQIRAAAAGVPAITMNRGLMGYLAGANKLGPLIQQASSEAIREAMRRVLEGALGGDFDRALAERFASRHTAAAFAETIINDLSRSRPRNSEARGVRTVTVNERT